MVLDFREGAPVFFGSYNFGNIFNAYCIGEFFCKVYFVIPVAVGTFKAHGKGFVNVRRLGDIA